MKLINQGTVDLISEVGRLNTVVSVYRSSILTVLHLAMRGDVSLTDYAESVLNHALENEDILNADPCRLL